MPFLRKDLETRYRLFDRFALNDQRNYYKAVAAKHRIAAAQINRMRASLAFFTGLSAAAAGLLVQSFFINGAPCTQLYAASDFAEQTTIAAEDAAAMATAEAIAQGVDPSLESDNPLAAQATAVAAQESADIAIAEATALETTTSVGTCNFIQQIIGIFTIFAIILPVLGALFSTLADLYQWDRLITIYDAAAENIEVADANSPEESIPDEVTYRAALMAYAEGTLSVMNDETAQWGQAIRTPAQLEEYVDQARERVAMLTKSAPPPADEDKQS